MTGTQDRVSRSRAIIAHEGWIWLLATAVIGVVCARLGYTALAIVMAGLTVFLVLLFRDPVRVVPPLPAAIYAPVDGRVSAVDEVDGADMHPRWWRIRIRASRLGAYTVRAPIEGTIHEIPDGVVAAGRPSGLRIRSEEGDDVLLVFPQKGLFQSPEAFVRYGERLGQGERFAYLRLASVAEVYLPRSCRVRAPVAGRVLAGHTVLGELRTG